jgi:large subunit ribosomal protein L13
MKTPSAKIETVERGWVLIDAEDQVLGRLASRVATILRGKDKVNYTPHVDTGEFVIIINADKVKLTGRKLEQKVYYRHTNYPSGIRETVAGKMLDEKPTRVIYKAVRNMIPNPGFRTGKDTMRKLKIYAGGEHPHQAQKPNRIEL